MELQHESLTNCEGSGHKVVAGWTMAQWEAAVDWAIEAGESVPSGVQLSHLLTLQALWQRKCWDSLPLIRREPMPAANLAPAIHWPPSNSAMLWARRLFSLAETEARKTGLLGEEIAQGLHKIPKLQPTPKAVERMSIDRNGSPASPAEAEELAKRAIADYLSACRIGAEGAPEAVGNYLMKLVSVAGVLMADAEGSVIAFDRLSATATFVACTMPEEPATLRSVERGH